MMETVWWCEEHGRPVSSDTCVPHDLGGVCLRTMVGLRLVDPDAFVVEDGEQWPLSTFVEILRKNGYLVVEKEEVEK